MSSVPVRLSTLEVGDFPSVCIKTGIPTEQRISTTLSVTPTWIWALLLCGIWPFFLAQLLATEKVPATIPVSDLAWSRASWGRRVAGSLLLVIAAAVAGVLLLDWRGVVAAWVIGVLIVAEIVALVVWNRLWVGLATGSHRGEVFVTRVHPEFARAYGRQVAHRSREGS